MKQLLTIAMLFLFTANTFSVTPPVDRHEKKTEIVKRTIYHQYVYVISNVPSRHATLYEVTYEVFGSVPVVLTATVFHSSPGNPYPPYNQTIFYDPLLGTTELDQAKQAAYDNPDLGTECKECSEE